jgi:hypothetical protein
MIILRNSPQNGVALLQLLRIWWYPQFDICASLNPLKLSVTSWSVL